MERMPPSDDATTSGLRRIEASGDLVFKPRDQWRAFCNAGDKPCRILEIIPAGDSGAVRGSGRGSGDGPFPRRPLRDRVRSRECGTPLRGAQTLLP
jgi:hypothetical protein